MRHNLGYYSKKWVWQSLSNIYFLSSYLQVVQTSTDLDGKFFAPFKATDFQQVQTCNTLQMLNTKKYDTMNWFHLDQRNGDFNDLESSSVLQNGACRLSVPASFTFGYT